MTTANKLYYVGQKAFIEKEGKVLVIQDPKEGIDFPGGRIQMDDTDIVEALKREVREETGLEVEVGNAFFTWTTILPMYHPQAGKEIFLVAYKCAWIAGDVVLSDEHNAFRWVDSENYKEYDNGGRYFEALKKYYECA